MLLFTVAVLAATFTRIRVVRTLNKSAECVAARAAATVCCARAIYACSDTRWWCLRAF